MEFTLTEMHILKEHFEDANEYSLFNNMRDAKGEGSLETLTDKGVYEDGKLNKAMENVLRVLAYPERIARFHLEQLEVNMRKHVYTIGDTQVLIEFHRENIIISMFESELDSLRTEISNHTGVAFQKHSLLKTTFDEDALICFAGIADWLRRIALSELTGQKVEEILTLDSFEAFLNAPLKLGIQSQVQALTHIKTPDSKGILKGLKALKNQGLVEDIKPKIEAGKSTILFGINFLVPNMAITLELYDLTHPTKTLMAREQIIQAAPKDNLSLSAGINGYNVESLTATEVLDKILAYLSTPSLNQSLQN